MSIKAERILDLFRDCRNLESGHKKHDGQLNFENLRENFPNDIELHRRLGYNATKKTARVLNFTSPNAELKPPVSKNINKEKNSPSDSPRNSLSTDLKRFISGARWRTASMEYSNLYRMMAVSCLETGNQLGAVQLLTESHATILQQQIYHRYSKTVIKNKYSAAQQEPGLRPIHMQYQPELLMHCNNLIDKLSVMPKEWYVVQVTVQYNELDYQRPNGTIVESLCPLHITILPTGPSAIDPFCITLPNPNNEHYDSIKELVKILRNNKADLQAYYSSSACYWKMRDKQNNKLKGAIMELEHSWLREWRILLMADPLNDTKLVKEMREMIDKLIADDLSISMIGVLPCGSVQDMKKVQISDRTRWLLRKIATSSCFLTKIEISRAVSYVLSDNRKLARNVILSIHGKWKSVNELRAEKRKTLIMIVDENIDHVPFESMDIVKTHPVTRFPSFNIAYTMFKEHEDTIVKGCKVVKRREKFGAFIVNPDKNLNKTERRMKLFINYWLPDWVGNYGIKPTETSYEQFVVNQDVLLYAGHGSGIQYLPGDKVEKLRIRSTVLLFGCSSVKLYPVGGIFPPLCLSNQYLIACSPCILGMLWEVTDGDIDRMTARFMSDWVPSNAERPWTDVDLNKWTDGILKFTGNADKNIIDCTNEPEMLRAVAKSKEICTQNMTAAAIIVRGLPLRLEP